MMKKFLFLPFIAVLVIVAGLIWFYKNSEAVSTNKNFSYFVVSKGESAGEVGEKLESAGYIKNALAFKLYLQITGQTGKLEPGEFKLTPSFTLFQTVTTLFKGPVEIWVTIPEGLRREEIAAKFAVALDKDSSFTTDFMQASKGKEGYLFPDTYLFPLDASASAIVKKMTSTFTAKTAGFKVQGSNLSFSQAVIVASLLERETKTDVERPTVAGIIIKRLGMGMPLQIDASVQYAIGTSKDWWPILGLTDLKVNSPYNTYKFTGLPPAPISNPGISTLEAAFNPVQSNYLYYIHDSTGQIHYAATLAEHNANVAKYIGK